MSDDLAYPRKVIVALTKHAGSVIFFVLEFNDATSLAQYSTQSLLDTIKDRHATTCSCPYIFPTAPPVWPSPGFTVGEIGQNSSLLWMFAPSPLARTIPVDESHRILAYLTSESQSVDAPLSIPVHFVIEMELGPQSGSKREREDVESTDVNPPNKRARKPTPTPMFEFENPVQLGGMVGTFVLNTFYNNQKMTCLDVFAQTCWLVKDMSPAIFALEKIPKSYNGSWAATIHVPDTLPTNFFYTFLSHFYDRRQPDGASFDSFGAFRIKTTDPTKAVNLGQASSIVLTFDFRDLPAIVDLRYDDLRAKLSAHVRDQLSNLLIKYRGEFSGKEYVFDEKLIQTGPEYLERVMECLQGSGFQVFLVFLGYDDPALKLWSVYYCANTTMPINAGMTNTKACFLEYHRVIERYRQGSDPVITRALYVGTTSSFAQSLGTTAFHVQDVSRLPAIIEVFGITEADARACFGQYLSPTDDDDKDEEEISKCLQILKDCAGCGSYHSSSGSEPIALFTPQVALIVIHGASLNQMATALQDIPVALASQWGADFALLATILSRSDESDAKHVAALLSGHTTYVDLVPISLETDGPVLLPEKSTITINAYAPPQPGTIVKLMIQLALVTYDPEGSSKLAGERVSVIVPNKSILRLLYKHLWRNEAFSRTMKRFDGNLEWLRDVALSFYMDRPLFDVRQIPEEALRNMLEKFINLGSNTDYGVSCLEVYGAIAEVWLLVNKHTGETARPDILVVPRRITTKNHDAARFLRSAYLKPNFLMECKSMRLHYMFKGMYGHWGEPGQLARLRQDILNVPQATWDAFLSTIPASPLDLDTAACNARARARFDARMAASPQPPFLAIPVSGATSPALDPSNMFVHFEKNGLVDRIPLRDIVIEARDQAVRYFNTVRNGVETTLIRNTRLGYVRDKRIVSQRPPDRENHSFRLVAVVLVGTYPLVDGGPTLATQEVYIFNEPERPLGDWH